MLEGNVNVLSIVASSTGQFKLKCHMLDGDCMRVMFRMLDRLTTLEHEVEVRVRTAREAAERACEQRVTAATERERETARELEKLRVWIVGHNTQQQELHMNGSLRHVDVSEQNVLVQAFTVLSFSLCLFVVFIATSSTERGFTEHNGDCHNSHYFTPAGCSSVFATTFIHKRAIGNARKWGHAVSHTRIQHVKAHTSS
jgi:hypothetical protein